MEKNIKEYRGHKIIELKGNFDFYCIDELKKYLFRYIKNNPPSLIIDLEKIENMDSSGIGLLVAVQKAMNKNGGKIGLLNVNNDIMELLKLAAIDGIFKIYKNPDEIEYRS